MTDLCVVGFDEETCRMRVERTHPGVTRKAIAAATGFDLIWPDDVPVSEAPTEKELQILRVEVDPHRYIIGRA